MMKAARWHNAEDIRVEQVEQPIVKDSDVKIKVAWTGICGSDLHEYAAGPILIPTEEHPLTKDKAPLILGHEFSGEVIEIGKNVEQIKIGDRVTVEPIYRCGECAGCRAGFYNLCDDLGFHGLAGGGGGFAEFTTVPEVMVHKIPDEMSYEHAAFVEPAAVALHAIRQSKLKAGDTAAVFGAGPIGLLTIEAALIAGADKVYVVELSEERRSLAEELGAIPIDPNKVNAVEEIIKLTDGGVNVSYEVTGVPVVLQQAIDSTKIQGETVIVSIWEQNPAIDANSVVLKERNIIGTIAYRDIFPATIDLMTKGKFSADRLITKKIALDDIVEEGFETLLHEKSQVKILVHP